MSTGESVRPEHLYFHVPFCRDRCPYCDYPVLASSEALAGAWLDAVAAELEIRTDSGVEIDGVRTVLVGGGTPSVLGSGLSTLRGTVLAGLPELEEWTVEANPEDIDDEVVRSWSASGVTRVSLGVQSPRAEALRWLGRQHDPDVGRRATDVLARSALDTWSIDLIFGLPAEIDADPVAGIERTLLGGTVPHIQLFELTLEGAPGAADLPDQDEVADQYLRFHERLARMGYDAYQMTCFARPGHRSAHAEGVLRSGSWLGLGPGAHSRLAGLRTWNLLDWGGYTRAIERGELPVERAERVDPATEAEEWIHGRLARSAGLSLEALRPPQLRLIDRWVRDGHAIRDHAAVRLTPSGWLLLDRLAHDLAGVDGRQE